MTGQPHDPQSPQHYPHAPAPQWQPPRQPPATRHRNRSAVIVVAILGTLGLLFAGCVAIFVAGAPDTAGGGVATPAAQGAATARVGDAARDGQFQFTVREVDCTHRQIGGEFGEVAQGTFCLVHMQVANVGNEPRTFSSSSQYGYDAAGRKFETDGVAGMHLDGANSFLEEINPGNAVNGIIVFDVPRGAKLAKVELHDSSFSGGVVVSLG